MLRENEIYECDYKEKINQIRDETVDLVLTDIPYMINRKTNYKDIKDYTKKDGSSSYSGMEFSFDDWELEDVEDYISHCCRILKKNGILIVWSSWQLLGNIESIIKRCFGKEDISCRIGTWIKTNPHPGNCDKKPVNSCEYFLWVAKGPNAVFNLIPYENKMLKGRIEIEKGYLADVGDSDKIINKKNLNVERGKYIFNENYERLVYIEPTVKGGIHPTRKPIVIFEHLIKMFSNIDELVFDGLMGSGTTAHACINTNRRYIGFERNKAYYEEAVHRINTLFECQ